RCSTWAAQGTQSQIVYTLPRSENCSTGSQRSITSPIGVDIVLRPQWGVQPRSGANAGSASGPTCTAVRTIKRASNPNSDLRNLRSFPSTRVSPQDRCAFSALRKASTTTTGLRSLEVFLRDGKRVRSKRLTCTDARMASPHLVAPWYQHLSHPPALGF